ncbi:MAG TPA: monooxygenase [Pseudonocardiaceae bacterium]
MPTLLQIDFPMDGPWGAELAEALRGLAEVIAATPGLRWKVWTENAAERRAGGVYLFDDLAAAEAYLAEHTERLRGFGITELRAVSFDVNEPLTGVTRGPLAG